MVLDSQAQSIIDSYLEAFWKITENQHEEIAKDCQKLLVTLANPTLHFHLCEGTHSQKDKGFMIDTIHKHLQLNPKTVIFLRNINKNGDLNNLTHIIESYYTKWDEAYNSIPGQLITAHQCPAETIIKLEEKLSKTHNRKVKITNVVKPKHIGGAMLNINGTNINLTYDKLLEQLEKELYQSIK